jgi:hypothetical protein
MGFNIPGLPSESTVSAFIKVGEIFLLAIEKDFSY